MSIPGRIRKYFFPTEMERIMRDAQAFPRYTSKEIIFRGFRIQMTDYLSVAWQLQEIFLEERLKFPASIHRPLIYDCGANIGIACLYFKSIFPNAVIRAFEPDPAVFACLKANIENNNLRMVSQERTAIWIHNEGIDFGIEGADGGSIYFPGEKKKVPSIRLSKLLETENEIDLLKMDIEGAEMEVIRDCEEQLSKVKYLFIEYHSWKNREQELDELLSILRKQNFRYTIHSIGKQVLQPFCAEPSEEGMDIQLDIHAIHLGHSK